GDGIRLFRVTGIQTWLVRSLRSTTLALELLRYLLPEWRRFNAYAGAGVIITWWSLDDTRLGLIVDDTLFGSIGSIVAVDDGQTSSEERGVGNARRAARVPSP